MNIAKCSTVTINCFAGFINEHIEGIDNKKHSEHIEMLLNNQRDTVQLYDHSSPLRTQWFSFSLARIVGEGLDD